MNAADFSTRSTCAFHDGIAESTGSTINLQRAGGGGHGDVRGDCHRRACKISPSERAGTWNPNARRAAAQTPEKPRKAPPCPIAYAVRIKREDGSQALALCPITGKPAYFRGRSTVQYFRDRLAKDLKATGATVRLHIIRLKVPEGAQE